ncbi:hypothetical protein MY11210_001572 [Beauveria gryllotalpidicola]
MKRKALDRLRSSSSSGSGSGRGSSESSSPFLAANRNNNNHDDPDTTITKPASSRRGHSKSRLGCLNCKRRRVKAGALVWAFVIPVHGASVFKTFTNESHSENLSRIVSEEPKDFDLVDEFLASVAKGLRVSSLQAWLSHAALWRAHCYFSNDDFQAFIAPDNHPARLLIAHMLLVDYFLGQFCVKDSEQFKFTARKEVIISWVRNAVCELPKEIRPYGDWLKGYCDVVEQSDGRYLLTP